MALEIRECRSSDIGDCIRLQMEIWGLSPAQAMSPITLTALVSEPPRCGLCLGAFLDGDMVGFSVVLGALDPGDCYGHMIGVRQDHRDAGLGRKLMAESFSLLQRRGLKRIFWTYEPLESRNAHAYLDKSGARGIKYLENHFGDYGAMHQGFPQDRFLAVLEFDRFERTGPGSDVRGLAELQDLPLAAPDFMPEAPEVLVEIPGDLQALKKRDMAAALAFRAATRTVFAEYLNRRGHQAVRLVTDRPDDADDAGAALRSFYLLRKGGAA